MIDKWSSVIRPFLIIVLTQFNTPMKRIIQAKTSSKPAIDHQENHCTVSVVTLKANMENTFLTHHI